MNSADQTLSLTSLMSDNAEFIVLSLADEIAKQLGIRIKVVNDIDWQDRERLLDAGTIQIAWICGLPYTTRADRAEPNIELLAAPVMAGVRYQGRPIYFSDVVVRKDSAFHTFLDLRGASWVYNEPNSHSGYNVVRYHLANLRETRGYFGRAVASGSHLKSIEMILGRQVDASAIDSTVLELEVLSHPALSQELRIVETLGPSPIPPWVIQKDVPSSTKKALTELLLRMHEDPSGREILARGQISRFVKVTDADYDPIRSMSEKARGVFL